MGRCTASACRRCRGLTRRRRRAGSRPPRTACTLDASAHVGAHVLAGPRRRGLRETDRQTDRSLSSPATPSLPPCWRVGEPEIADKTCSNYLGGKGGRRKKNNKKQKRKN